MLDNNGLRMFKCDECKVNKMVVKKSVNDSKFRCETCIQNQIQNEVQAQMPTTETTVDTTPQFSWRWLQFFT
jgi:transcription elongation factor Elf1